MPKGQRWKKNSRQCGTCPDHYVYKPRRWPGMRRGTCPACVAVFAMVTDANKANERTQYSPRKSRAIPEAERQDRRVERDERSAPAVLYGLLTAADVAVLERRRPKPPANGFRTPARECD